MPIAVPQWSSRAAGEHKKQLDADSARHLNKNAKVWCKDSSGKWVEGVLHLAPESGPIVCNINNALVEVEPERVYPANPEVLEGVSDLIQLSYLNEPSVLHNLEFRYDSDMIYTRAGPLLVAINPFRNVPLYTSSFVEKYRETVLGSPGPHIYDVAGSAYKSLIRDGASQSLIISGESGAGKTETAKIAMQYLAVLGGGRGLESDMLQTNPLLEAFGNAKTLRNNNSSRFGKLIDIHFDDKGAICGAKIQTYLLEKSRVVYQADGERSFHVFYQLCAGANAPLRERLNLKEALHYAYLNGGACLKIDEMDDAEQFRLTVNALDAVKVSKQEQEKLFEMLATVLWIGNLTFSVLDNENHVMLEENDAAESVAKLLDCDLHDLGTSLCARDIRARGEVITQKLTDKQAIDARDALAKALYACIFDWLVEKMNNSLDSADCSSTHFISILDIYGFESFETNNFEQLCINYANERLQQHFNQHLFKLEQEEYTREGINWTKIEFEDNQDCLDLLEKRPLGLFALLDEESSFPKATDATLCMKLDEHLKGNACFKAERLSGFRINHYAGEVAYDTSRFLERNRDAVHADLLQLLKLCRHELAQSFATKLSDRLEVQKRTVSAKFKNQLAHLMERLGSTKPHFVRCIKPNSQQLPNLFDEDLVLQQLRWCGVLEVVRISRSRYPTRYPYHYFAERYGFLLGCCSTSEDSVATCLSLLKRFSIPEEAFQTGASKIFFRAGQIGVLEHLRARTLNAILRTQTQLRGYQVRTWYTSLRRAAIHLQALARARRARLQYKELKLAHRSSTTIQASVRRMLARKTYKELLTKSSAVTVIQKYARAAKSRRRYLHHQQKAGAAIVIQRHTRRWLHAKALFNDWKRKRCAAVTLQRIYRGRIAKRKHIQLCTKVQAAVRGWLQRKRLNRVPDVDDGEYVKITETDLDSEPSVQVSAPSTVVELQRRLLETEQKLCKKEDENSELHSRLKLYEERWTEYETKMNTMEKMWHDKILQLQTNLEAAKRTLANTESITFKGTKQSNSLFQRTPRTARPMLPSPDEEFEDESDWWDDATSIATESEAAGVHEVQLQQQQQQQQKQQQEQRISSTASGGNREMDAGKSVVDHLSREFDHRSQVFKDDVVFIVEVKSGEVDTTVGVEPEMELRRLKLRFDSWKKEFKVQIREAKMLLHKLEVGDRSKKKWWGKKANH